MLTLFRTRALKARYRSSHDTPTVRLSDAQRRLGCGLLLCCLMGIVWLCSNSYSRKATVRGWLDFPGGSTVLKAPLTGTIAEVLVRDGQQVAAGTALLRLKAPVQASPGPTLGQLRARIQQDQARLLSRQLKELEAQFAERRARLSARCEALTKQLDSQARERSLLHQRTVLAHEQLERLQQLAVAGHAPAQQIDARKAEQLTLKEQLLRLDRDREALTAELTDARAALRALHNEAIAARTPVELEQAALRLNQAEVAVGAERLLRAPRAGIVAKLRARAGDWLAAGEALLTLRPNSAALELVLWLPVEAAAFVRPGLPLTLRYDAYPYQKFGLATGAIRTIDPLPMDPTELRTAPLPLSGPHYQLRGVLEAQTVRAYGRHQPLKAGMTVTADISLGQRTLMEWLLEPVLGLKGRL